MDDASLFYTFTSFTYPTSIFRYDVARAEERDVPRAGDPGAGRRPVRDHAGVRHQQGRGEGADVPGPQEGPGAGRQQSDPDVRLRRLQHRDHAGLQLAAHCAPRAGLRLRQRQHARRQRVRRGLARRGHEAEEAERVRRLHRRRGVAHRQQVHVAGAPRRPGRLEWRPAGGRRDQPAAGSLPGRDPAGRRDGHAAVPQVHDRLELDRRLRLQRQRRRSSRRSTPTRRSTTSRPA